MPDAVASTSYNCPALNKMRMDGISIPHRLSALETSNADVHNTRFSGFILFSNVGPVQKFMIWFAFFRMVAAENIASSSVPKLSGKDRSSAESLYSEARVVVMFM